MDSELQNHQFDRSSDLERTIRHIVYQRRENMCKYSEILAFLRGISWFPCIAIYRCFSLLRLQWRHPRRWEIPTLTGTRAMRWTERPQTSCIPLGLTIFLVLKLLRLASPPLLPVFIRLVQCEVQIWGELSGLFRKQWNWMECSKRWKHTLKNSTFFCVCESCDLVQSHKVMRAARWVVSRSGSL